MDLKTLSKIPSWEWPEDAGKKITAILLDKTAAARDRLLAVELAGEPVVAGDELVDALVSILRGADEPEALRAGAAIALGPTLEDCDLHGFDEPGDAPISEAAFKRIRALMRKLYRDAAVPEEVRRRILEAAVRAPEAWHSDAIRAAYASGRENWKLTAVFCMRFVKGFEKEIEAALESKNPEIYAEAIGAAGEWSVDAAWPHVTGLIASNKTPKHLLLAAIEAVVGLRPEKADEVLGDLLDSEDEEIADAVEEAMAMARVEREVAEGEYPEEDDFDDDEEGAADGEDESEEDEEDEEDEDEDEDSDEEDDDK